MAAPYSLDIFIPLVVLEEDRIEMEVSPTGSGSGTYDYTELINKPSINGEELIGNYNEIDPTVPEWAKEATKPNYTPEEVGAIDEDNEVSFADLLSAWNNIFEN